MKDRRLGRFEIKWFTIDERPHHARAILKDLIVVEARCHFHTQSVEYVAIGPQFSIVDEYSHVSEYEPEIKTNGVGEVVSVKWVPRGQLGRLAK